MKKRVFGLIVTALLLSSCGSTGTSSSSSSSASISSSSASSSTPTSSSSDTSSQASSSSNFSASISSSSASSSTPTSSSGDSSSSVTPTPVPKEKITINKVDNITDDFIRGMDASSVISLENSGVSYYDFDGYKKDLFEILANNGVTDIRIRIWNDPYDGSGNGYGGGNNDVDTAIAIGKRVQAAGMKTIVDFHYSDFWADPLKYSAPKQWSSYSISQKETALYNFTVDALNRFKTNNIEVSMVQIGNEINSGMAGESYSFNKSYSESENYFKLLDKASEAVRYVYPKSTTGVKIAVHFTDAQKNRFRAYADDLHDAGIDYDVFGASYYRQYHGTQTNLATELNKVVDTYGKEVMVLETSYPYTNVDSDGEGNSYGNPDATDEDIRNPVSGYDFNVNDQAKSYRDICDVIVNDVHDNKGIGVCYWEGAWISVGSKDWNTNYSKWDTYGSGWISRFAAGYDPDLMPGGDSKYYSHGCLIDNQAFFDMYGKPLSSLEVFKYLKTGYYPNGEPETTHTLNIVLNITTPPSGSVNIVYSVNGDDPYLSGLSWNVMSGSDGLYSYAISDLNKDDVVYFRFATWDSSAGNLYICADNTWIGASQTMPNSDVTLTCAATAFPASDSEVTTFEIS